MMIVPNQMRAQTTAAYYFVINIFGLTLGPLLIALVTAMPVTALVTRCLM